MDFIVPCTLLLLGAALAIKSLLRFRILNQDRRAVLSSPLQAVFDAVESRAPEKVHSPAVKDLLVKHERRSELRWTLFCVGLAALGAVGLYLAQEVSLPNPVHVTSLDGSAREIAVPHEGGLALRTALDEASVGDQKVDAEGEPLLVALRIPGDERTDIWYCPAALAWQTHAGDWPVPGGSSVRIIAFQDTNLGTLVPIDAGATFEVKGMIERPGKYKTQEMSETVVNVSSEPYGRTFEPGDNGPDLLVVHRKQSEQAPQEHYCIPIKTEFADLVLLSSRIRKGDIVEYTTIEEVRESLQ